MKRTLILFSIVAICSAITLSCKNNNKKAASQNTIQEETLAQKQELADSVLSVIDQLTESYIDAANQCFKIRLFELSEKEKMVKPDYLLEPSYVNRIVTKSQKITALAYYSVDRLVREIYEMPTDEIDEIMAKLIVELDHPWEDYSNTEIPVSERMKKAYQLCKERGDLSYFWWFQNAILCETNYILAKNPELFFSRISEENLEAYNQRWACLKAAIRNLAEYDEQMKVVANTTFSNPTNEISDEKLKNRYFKNVKTATETYKLNKLNQIEKRNALLQ